MSETESRQPDLTAALELAEARAWLSMSVVRGSKPILDEQGNVAATALSAEPFFPLANRVVGLGLTRPVSRKMLEQIEAAYGHLEEHECVFIPIPPTVRPSSLPRQLRDLGFLPSMKEAKLYRSAHNPPPVDPLHRVVKLGQEDRNLAESLYRDGGMQADWAEAQSGNLGRLNWHHFVSLDGDEPVALASMFASEGHAVCFPGFTLPDHRYRGHQRALASYRIAAAEKLGCDWVSTNLDVTEGPMGYNLRSFTRLGFELLYLRTTHIRHQPTATPLDAYSRRMLTKSS